MKIEAEKMTDAELKKYQRKLLKICAFCESGIRIGVATPKFVALAKEASETLSKIENEFCRRHPEEKERRNQQFLRACETLLDWHNIEEYGTDDNAAGIEYFTEYNVPEIGKKQGTCWKTFVDETGETQQQTTVAAYTMKPYDLFFAELEDAMDEYAETLPEVPAEV